MSEFLHDRIGARTLFATHYHELVGLAQEKERVRNYSVAVREWNGEIIFLRKIVEGGTDKSYGIQVARLAGVPKTVIERAKVILDRLEDGSFDTEGAARFSKEPGAAPSSGQLSLFGEQPDELRERLADIDLDATTPIAALLLLRELKELS